MKSYTKQSSSPLQLLVVVLVVAAFSAVATGTSSKVVVMDRLKPLSVMQLAKDTTTTNIDNKKNNDRDATTAPSVVFGEDEEDGGELSSLGNGSTTDPCAAYYYIPSCLSATSADNSSGTPITSSLNCTWCCGATSQCVSGSSTCPQPTPSAVSWRIDVNTNTSTSSSFSDFLEHGGSSLAGASMYTTCQSICSEIGILSNKSSVSNLKSVAPTLLRMCTPCTVAPFCYFCGSRGGSCIGGNGYCKDGVIVQDCEYLDGGSKGVVIAKDSDNFFLNMSLQSTTMMMMLMMSIMCGLGLLLYMIPRIVRRRRERLRLEALEVAWRRDFRNANGGEGDDGTPAPTPTSGAVVSPSASRRRGGGAGRGRGGRGGAGAPTTNPPPSSSTLYPPPPVPATESTNSDTATATATRQAADTESTNAASSPAAVVAEGYIPTTISSPTPSPSSSGGAAMLLDDADDDNTCLLCYEQPRSVAFIPCYHAYYCRGCSNKIRPTAGAFICPSCRQPVEAMVDYTRALKEDH